MVPISNYKGCSGKAVLRRQVGKHKLLGLLEAASFGDPDMSPRREAQFNPESSAVAFLGPEL